MENDRGDPPLSPLYIHQMPRYECPDCAAEHEPGAAEVIKSILAKATRSLRRDQRAGPRRWTGDPLKRLYE
jgi:hypothetical protein